MTTPVSEDGLTWTFTVTAENGDTQNYTLIITIEQPEPEEPVQQSTPEYMAWLPGFLLMNTKYKLTAEAGEGGFITPEGTTKVQFGGNITYSITPMEGYAIKAVYVDGKDIGTPDEYTFRSVITEHSIRVEFEAIDGE